MPADASLFDGLRTKPLLALIPHSLSQIEPLIWSSPSDSNHKVSCALVTGDISDTGGGTLIPSVSCIQSNLLRKAHRHSISEAGGEVGEEGAAVVIWTAAAAAGAAAGVAATGLKLGGGSGGSVATGAGAGVAATGSTMGGVLCQGSRHLTLLMLSVADLFSSFPILYKASIWVHLGRGVVTFSTTPLYNLVSQLLPKWPLHSA